MIRVKKDWWKDYFDGGYLVTDARSVCDAALTRREVSLVEKLLGLNKDDRILDLFGGQGRHSLEMAKKGYLDLSVLDYSPYLVNMGRRLARKENKKIKFYRADARSTGLRNADFSVVLVMANSFGYFDDQRDDIRVLKEIKRLLRNRGRLLLDLTDADYVKKNFIPTSCHKQGGDITILRTRELKRDRITAREVVISGKKGLLRDGSYSERLYTGKKIKTILNDLGFGAVSIYKGVSLHKKKKDYGFLTSRMLVTACAH